MLESGVRPGYAFFKYCGHTVQNTAMLPSKQIIFSNIAHSNN